MPAERTRGPKRTAAEGVQLTWTTPVDASVNPSIAFAPNVTPGTYNDPPSPVNLSAESALFPSTNDSPTSNRRPGHAKKKPENHIPRPPNAFILFRSSFIKNQHVSSEVETNHSTLSKIIGLTWQNLPHEERQIWHAKAKAALEEHKRKWPEYAFRPLHTKGKGGAEKRKVREVGPKDLKRCAKIAELLVEGKKGAELDVAIQEFDRHHVPEIVTRFETPITARTYRRSSSAPVPDTEHSKLPTFLSETPSTPSCKIRASSSQPESPYTLPSSECYSPSVDFESDCKSFHSTPSSALSPSSDAYPTANPSFDFSTFSFNTCAASPVDSCDPLSAGCERSFDVFPPVPQESCSSQDNTFDVSCLSIDTTFVGNWTAASSPLSSMPGTPHSFSATHNGCDSSAIDFSGMPPLVDSLVPPYLGFFDQDDAFVDGASAFGPSQMVDTQFGAPTYTTKNDFSSSYDRSALDYSENSFSPSFLAPVPTFVM
ncbi:hypothetical protein AcV7_002579 [Taiwanofungus camphoratus]|nr:hypothetical protein AcV7_002579 [Antrodia cinnamomea]